jgi:hypothetical protein
VSHVTVAPIKWKVERLMCDCGGEYQHKFSVKYKVKPFMHVCDKCSSIEETADVYPKTVWVEG